MYLGEKEEKISRMLFYLFIYLLFYFISEVTRGHNRVCKFYIGLYRTREYLVREQSSSFGIYVYTYIQFKFVITLTSDQDKVI